MSSRSYMGSGFEVWNSQRTWFWFVVDPLHNGGAIGAAANEADAIREACSSIEAMSAQRRAGLAAFQQSNQIALDAPGWEGVLVSLERYLTSVCRSPV